jgi:hypothetical protein
MNPDTTQTSEEYVNRTLSRLQKSYRVTLTIAIIILAAEGIYLTVLNNKLASGLTVIGDYVENYQEDFDSIKKLAGQIPETTDYSDRIAQFEKAVDKINEAKNAKGMANLISQRIVNELNWQGDMITDYAQEFLKEEIQDLPEQLKNQVPKYSNRLSNTVTDWANEYCTSASDELGDTFDTFLDNHADQIREFSEAADDEAALAKLDVELTREMAHFMETTPLDNYGTLQEQSEKMLSRIKAANELLRPLATKKTEDLTPEERRLRRAVGLFMDRVENPPVTSSSN